MFVSVGEKPDVAAHAYVDDGPHNVEGLREAGHTVSLSTSLITVTSKGRECPLGPNSKKWCSNWLPRTLGLLLSSSLAGCGLSTSHRKNWGSLMSDASEPIDAATVVVARDSADGVEVLMLRRNSKIYFGGMWVFPGGRVDP